MASDSRPVYSTEHGSLKKSSTAGRSTADSGQSPSPGRGVRVGRETKGRKGAGATVITGLAMTEAELKNLLTTCKKRLGCGGTLKNGVLEFQGEHRDKLITILTELGMTAKKSGG